MTSSVSFPRRELRSSTKHYADGDSVPAWDVYLDDRLVASEYVALADARMELDFAVWYALFGDTTLNPSALITDEALGLAMQVFNRLFSAEKIQEKVRTARDKIITAGIFSIQSDGSLSVLASSSRGKQATYTVTSTCTCKDFFTHAHLRGGVCKHIAARMLLVLSQHGVGYLKHLRDALDAHAAIIHGSGPIITAPAADSTPDAPTANEAALAFLQIGAADLAAAMFLAQRANAPITIHAENGALHLVAGAIDLSIPGLDGGATCAVRLETDAFAALYEQIRPAVKRAGALTIFVATDGSLVFDSQETGFSASAQGTYLPIRAPSTATSESASITSGFSSTDSDIADALQLLFGLLEAHEPEWYLKKHFRIAHDALAASGRLAA
jgi:hypothetical protein